MDTSRIVRMATLSDQDSVLELFNEFSEFLGSDDRCLDTSEAIYREMINRDDTFIFVAEEGANLLGLVTLYLIPNVRHGWHRGHIEDMFVSESARKSGVAQLLFEEVKNYCKEIGVKVIKLDSGNELTDAHRFYEKQGGKSTERFFRFDL
jgi:GNAT superfamily N-acetyltransferase